MLVFNNYIYKNKKSKFSIRDCVAVLTKYTSSSTCIDYMGEASFAIHPMSAQFFFLKSFNVS
jgi:hypothetical protein